MKNSEMPRCTCNNCGYTFYSYDCNPKCPNCGSKNCSSSGS